MVDVQAETGSEELVARLHFDEDADLRLARALRRRGYDVSTTPEAELGGCSDEEQLAYAASPGRVLVTHNIAHFPGLYDEWWEQGKAHAGIIVIARGLSVGKMLREIERLLNRYEVKKLRNMLFILGRSGF